ncbi:hypothetical protein ACLB2K_054975 [Fragaria x ananassa]
MSANAAVPFWRAAGMTYITYSNICANLVRNCLKEPYKTEALSREKVHFSVSKWADGKPEKPILAVSTLLSLLVKVRASTTTLWRQVMPALPRWCPASVFGDETVGWFVTALVKSLVRMVVRLP